MTESPATTVELPRLVCQLTGVPHRVEVAGTDTHEVLAALLDAHPGLRPHLLDSHGSLRTNVLCAVDGRRTRLETPQPVRPGSVLRFVGSVAGG